MFPITWGGVWDYPYPEAQALISGHARHVRRRQAGLGFGYAECRTVLHLHAMRRLCAAILWFSQLTEKDAILGGNVGELLGIGSV